MKISFKESLILTEVRDPNLKYTDKIVKNKIDRVTTELSGIQSAQFTKLAARFDRLKKAIETMAKKRDEIQDELKTNVENLFNPEDIVYTRIVETPSFTLTLSKIVKSSEQDPKIVVNYQKIAEELTKLIPEELQAKVEEITKMYTETSIAPDKSPALRVKSKVDESLTGGVLDVLKKISSKVKTMLKSFASWAVRYDEKLDDLNGKLEDVRFHFPVDDYDLKKK